MHNRKKRLGTFGAIKNIKKKLTKNFIVINGDTIFDANLERLKNSDLKKELVMFLTKKHSYKENKKLTNLGIKKNKIIFYSKKNNYINSGTYLLSKKIFNKKFINKSSLENDVISKLIEEEKINGYIQNKELIDVGTSKNLIYANNNIKKLLEKPAIFLDRDGVINHDYGYVFKYSNFKFRHNVIRALKFLTKKNIYIFIVTNQAGIAKGYFKKKRFLQTTYKNKKLFSKEGDLYK